MTRKPHKTPPAQPYQYNELPRDGSFRYIVLHRGTGNDPLKCSLQTAPLAKTTFEAISYVWGKSKKNKTIICDGRVIRITKSLSNVLRRLRLPHKRRKLWADGICINQDDLEEKGHQVAIMGDIYRSAKCVLIYIGLEDYGDGPLACSLVDDVYQLIDLTCKDINMEPDAFPELRRDSTLLSDSRWNALFNLFRQSWFKRGWVVREAAVAQYGLVIWHNSVFSWKKLIWISLWLQMRGSQVRDNFDFWSGTMMSHMQASRQREEAFVATLCDGDLWPAQSLLSQLHSGRFLQLSNPRDRVYAFMELFDSRERPVAMNPDYHLSPPQVYHQFAVRYIQETKDIQILDYICHPHHREFLETPSWVPRWDDDSRISLPSASVARKLPTSARDGSICEPKIIDDHILSVKGVIFDSVLYVSDIFQGEEEDQQEMFSEAWAFVSQTLNTSPYGTHRSLDAFIDCFSCGMIWGNAFHYHQSRATMITYRKTHGMYGRTPSADPPHDDELASHERVVWHNMKNAIANRRFISTRRGYWGVAPDITREDDLCAIIFGCEMPCILEQTSRKQHYEYVGATWLLGSHSDSWEGYGDIRFNYPLGADGSKEWVDWDVEEQDIYLV